MISLETMEDRDAESSVKFKEITGKGTVRLSRTETSNYSKVVGFEKSNNNGG